MTDNAAGRIVHLCSLRGLLLDVVEFHLLQTLKADHDTALDSDRSLGSPYRRGWLLLGPYFIFILFLG